MKIIIFSILLIINTIFVFSQEYNLYYSGLDKGFITIKKESNGKITITPRMQGVYSFDLSYEICSLLLKGEYYYIYSETKLITFDGNTTTETFSDGSWSKTVVNGNTTTKTFSDGSWCKTVVDGNTTTTTFSDGSWHNTIADGNTTKETSSTGSWKETYVEGNTTIKTYSDDSWEETFVDKQGFNIYIITKGKLK